MQNRTHSGVTSGLCGYELRSAKPVGRNVIFSDPAAGNPKGMGFTELDFPMSRGVGEELCN